MSNMFYTSAEIGTMPWIGIVTMMAIFALWALQEKNVNLKIMIMICMITVTANFTFSGPLSGMFFTGAEIASQITITLLCIMTLLLKRNTKLHRILRIATLIVCGLSMTALAYSNAMDMLLYVKSLQR